MLVASHSAGQSPLDESRISAVRNDPRFGRAFDTYARLFSDVHRGESLVDKLAAEEGRFFVGRFLIDLHANRDSADPKSGATLSRLQEICAAEKVASPGRVAALVSRMRVSGYVEAVPSATDSRFKLLIPTDKMIAHTTAWAGAHLSAVEVLQPGTHYVERLPDPAFLWAFERAQGRLFFAPGGNPFAHVPELRPYLRRDAGYLILLSLFLRPGAAIGTPGPWEVEVAHAAIAERFAVSRSHVHRLLSDAEADGLVTSLRAERKVRVEPKLVSLIYRFVALALSIFAHNAALALRECAAREGAA